MESFMKKLSVLNMIHNRAALGVMLALVFVGTVAYTSFATSSEQGKSSGIEWQEFSKALELAKKEKKMVVVDFYADWCSWCKRMDKDTYGNPEVIKYAKSKLIMTKVDTESQAKTRFKDRELTYRELAAGMGVRGLPTTAFFDSNGDPITSISSYLTPDQFLPILEFLSDGHYKNMKFEDFMKQRKS